MNQGLQSFWICGINFFEATNWSVIGDLNYLVIIHVEGISKTYFL